MTVGRDPKPQRRVGLFRAGSRAWSGTSTDPGSCLKVTSSVHHLMLVWFSDPKLGVRGWRMRKEMTDQSTADSVLIGSMSTVSSCDCSWLIGSMSTMIITVLKPDIWRRNCCLQLSLIGNFIVLENWSYMDINDLQKLVMSMCLIAMCFGTLTGFRSSPHIFFPSQDFQGLDRDQI